jgi:hypothetical protein
MKKSIFSFSLFFIFILASCGPAAEDRQAMHERAKVFQDSIANVIKTSMAEAAAPGPNAVVAPMPQATPAPLPAGAQQPVQPTTPSTGVNQTK